MRNSQEKKKVLLGMSGGIDSSFVATILQNDGYEVIGVYMKLHNIDKLHRENYKKIKNIKKKLKIKTYFYDLSKEFKNQVYKYFVDTYINGSTPNPCVVCNRNIKFGEMIKFADKLGIYNIATGHYVKSDKNFIYKGKDSRKDQSYFLAQIDKKIIPRLIFPLGDKMKKDIINKGSKIDYLTSIIKEKESNEICFVENSYVDVIEENNHISKKGDVINKKNEIIGEHKGYVHYTIGQRKGFTVYIAHKPNYVVSIDAKNNQITVGEIDELKQLNFSIKNINFFIDDLKNIKASVKVRFRAEAVSCNLSIENRNLGKIELYDYIFGISKGQLAVFYIEDRIIASGTIL